MNELVKINDNNQVTTDSLTVADRFGKRHCDVLRSIKMLKCSKEFSERNFASAEYLDEQGKPRTYYDITRDGWMFLVMGFTGEKAAEWKEKFIAAFNRMETTISKMSTVPSLTQDRAALKAIGGIVKKCAAVAVREEVAKIMTSSADTSEPWEISDTYLMQILHDWHLTRNKTDVVKMQELIRQNEEYKRRLSTIKQAVI